MIRAISQKQLPLSEFKTPFEATMDENNRWVILAQVIPWDQMAEPYMACFHNTQGWNCNTKPTQRLIIWALLRFVE